MKIVHRSHLTGSEPHSVEDSGNRRCCFIRQQQKEAACVLYLTVEPEKERTVDENVDDEEREH